MTPLLRQAALVAYKSGSDLAGKAAVFAVLLLAARALTTEAFGLLSLASTLGWMLAVGTDGGMQLYLARAVAREPDRAAECLRPLLRLRLQTSLGALALVAGPAVLWVPSESAVAFVLIVAAYLASALVEFLNHVYRGLARSDLESSINLVQRLVTLAAAFVMLSLWPRLDVLALALVLPPVGAFLFSLSVVRRLTVASSAPAGVRTAGLSRAVWLSDVMPIGIAMVLSALYFRVDVFLLGYWSGMERVAEYNAVFRLVEALRLFPAALLVVILPVVFRRRDARFVWVLSASLVIFGVVVAALLYGHTARLIEIAYGVRYLGANPALQVLLLAFPLLSLNYGLTHQLIGWDGQRAYAAICGLALVVNLALCAVLIPRFAGLGAAWATLGTEVCLTVACVLALRRRSPSRGGQWPAN